MSQFAHLTFCYLYRNWRLREISKYNITYESPNINKVQEIIMHNLTDMFKKLI